MSDSVYFFKPNSSIQTRLYAVEKPNRRLTTQHLTPHLLSTSSAEYLAGSIHPGRPLVIAFGAWVPEGLGRFEWLSTLEKLRPHLGEFNVLLLRDTKNAWYQRGMLGLGQDVQATADAIQKHIQQIQPSMVVTVGASMGAYAAIMFAKLLGVARCLAFAPLSTLDIEMAKAAGEWRWLDIMQTLASEPTGNWCPDLLQLLNQDGPYPEVHLVYGLAGGEPGAPQLDPWHAQRLAQANQVFLHPIAEAQHDVAWTLKHLGLLPGLLLELIDRPQVLRVDSHSHMEGRGDWTRHDGWLSGPHCPAPMSNVGITLNLRCRIAADLLSKQTPQQVLLGLLDDGITPEAAMRAVADLSRWCRFNQGRPNEADVSL